MLSPKFPAIQFLTLKFVPKKGLGRGQVFSKLNSIDFGFRSIMNFLGIISHPNIIIIWPLPLSREGGFWTFFRDKSRKGSSS